MATSNPEYYNVHVSSVYDPETDSQKSISIKMGDLSVSDDLHDQRFEIFDSIAMSVKDVLLAKLAESSVYSGVSRRTLTDDQIHSAFPQ